MDFLYEIFNVIKARKSFRLPRKSKILIYDNCGSELICWYLVDYKPEILYTRKEILYVKFLFSCLFKKNIKTNYIDSYINYVDPLIIITFIDNNAEFYLLKSRHPKRITILIQNGIRTKYGPPFASDFNSKYFVDHMLLFGKKICDEYSKVIKGKTYSIGSFKNNFHIKHQATLSNSITFISTYTDSSNILLGNLTIPKLDFMRVEVELLEYLIKFCNKNKKHIILVLRNKKNVNEKLFSDESKFFKKIFEKENFSNYVISNKNSSYDDIDSSELIIGVDSTLLYESIAREKKTFIFSSRNKISGLESYNFAWPLLYNEIGPFWSNNLNEDIFNECMMKIQNLDRTQWIQEVSRVNYLVDVMNYEFGNSTFQKIVKSELFRYSKSKLN